MKAGKIITICASASHYKQVLEIREQLMKLKFQVKIPKIAFLMKKTNNFDVSFYKTWFNDKNDYRIKTGLMKSHFKKVLAADAVLIANFTKKGLEGYIGGNVLMEMVIAFHHHKPIYIYNQISEDLPVAEEVYGLEPIFINCDLSKIK